MSKNLRSAAHEDPNEPIVIGSTNAILFRFVPQQADESEGIGDRSHSGFVIAGGILLMLAVQLPALIGAFVINPAFEWGMIGSCFVGALSLAMVASWFHFSWNRAMIAIFALAANIFMGGLLGEILHGIYYYGTTLDWFPNLGWFFVGAIALPLFVWSFISDVHYVRSGRNLDVTQKVWATWGISMSSVWWIVHTFVHVSRVFDYLTVHGIEYALSFFRDGGPTTDRE